MHKKLFFISLLFAFQGIKAQQVSVFYETRPARISYFPMEACNTGSTEDMKLFLEKQLNCSLRLSHTSVNKYARTYAFDQVKNSIEVYQGFAKVIIDNNSHSFLVCYDIYSGLPDRTILKPGACWFYHNNDWVLATKIVQHNAEENSLDEIITDENNFIISRKDLALRGQPSDTTIRVHVFNPDPLTSAHKTYGAPYMDYNDSDVAVLNAERKWQTVTCTYLNDTFWLSNKYLVPFKNDLNTSFDPVYRLNDTFDYTRHQHQFEDVMVMYHITTYQDYINGLGFDTLGYRPTPYDAHGQSSDNSMFLPGVGLIYGTGGIDDAEDAEVITHEYTHSLREYASPSTDAGLERQSIEEALCDYMSTSYKMAIDSFGWKKWAYWDGNYGNWNGRDMASPKIYPQALTGNIYQNSEIFSSALMRIYFKLGKNITDRLTLQTLYYLVNNLTMQQTALLFIKADTTLYSGIHTDMIWRTFAETHLLPWMTGITKAANINADIKLLNSLNFMEGKGNLSVYLPKQEQGTYTVTNNLNQSVIKENFSGDNFNLANGIIKSPGVYYLIITTASYSVTRKFIIQ
jgi:hypothetical protein